MKRETRVLVADPDAEKRDLYRRFLEHCGYEVETANDGLDCCEKLAERAPNIIVLEQGLLWGGTDGVLARIREDGEAPPVPIILIAGERDSDERAVAFIDPVVTRLQRPFRMSDLVQCLACAGRQAVHFS